MKVQLEGKSTLFSCSLEKLALKCEHVKSRQFNYLAKYLPTLNCYYFSHLTSLSFISCFLCGISNLCQDKDTTKNTNRKVQQKNWSLWLKGRLYWKRKTSENVDTCLMILPGTFIWPKNFLHLLAAVRDFPPP